MGPTSWNCPTHGHNGLDKPRKGRDCTCPHRQDKKPKSTLNRMLAAEQAAEQKRRARVEELCVLAKELIRVVRAAPTPEHALPGVLTVLAELDAGVNT